MECKQLIQKEYTFHILHKGSPPASVKAFTDAISLLEKDFYHLYPSFEELEKAIFLSYFQETIEKLQQDSVFMQYNTGEKVLAFYYTWFEVLRMHKSFITYLEKQKPFLVRVINFVPLGNKVFKFLAKQAIAAAPPYLLHVHTEFTGFMKPLLNEAIGEEIADRFWISSQYAEVLWGQAILLYRYWLNDKSPNFEKTDIFIEKSTQFVFDLLRPNAWDTGFDLVKFMVQRK